MGAKSTALTTDLNKQVVKQVVKEKDLALALEAKEKELQEVNAMVCAAV